jgi:transposase
MITAGAEMEPDSTVCPYCGGDLHVIGENSSKRLDKLPAKLRVIVTRRPKYACLACEKTGADDVAGMIQASAPARLIEGRLRHGVRIERLTLAQRVGAAAAELQPLRRKVRPL